jgi:hypothetical protein
MSKQVMQQEQCDWGCAHEVVHNTQIIIHQIVNGNGEQMKLFQKFIHLQHTMAFQRIQMKNSKSTSPLKLWIYLGILCWLQFQKGHTIMQKRQQEKQSKNGRWQVLHHFLGLNEGSAFIHNFKLYPQRKKNWINLEMFATMHFRILSSHLLPKNVKIKIYKTIIILAVLYGCETWSLVFVWLFLGLQAHQFLRLFEPIYYLG